MIPRMAVRNGTEPDHDRPQLVFLEDILGGRFLPVQGVNA